MRLSKLRIGLTSIACVLTVAGLLAGCSGNTASTSANGGGSNPSPIQGVATPHSVSVVTAN